MKKLILPLLLLGVFALSAAGCSSKQDSKTLNILTWDGYIPQDVLDGYTAQTGVKINFTNFDENEEMLTKLQASKGGDYDIVIASDYIIDIARKQGKLLAELDKSKIPNYKNIDTAFQSQFYDPDNRYTIPYAAGTPLIVYDPAKVSIDIKGYSDLWDPSLKDSVASIATGRVVIGIVLKSMGYSFNTADEAVLKQAEEKLMQLKPNIRALSNDNPHGLLMSGEASVGFMFTPQVIEAMEARQDLVAIYPEEGMGFGIDCVFVPYNAPHKDNAYSFINYILDGKVGADIASQILYVCPNSASAQYLPDNLKNNKCLYIPADILGDTEFIEDVGAATEIYDRIWTRFIQQ